MATAAPQMVTDNRIHSTVYHKRDSRLNNIIRRCKKSEIISLYNINTLMLFRVNAAHIQFDMLENHRPYILFHGRAEGVYLPASTGLLFPNACDQLDFRNDYPVDAMVTYALSDAEIATFAANGLFNYDWSCQGRVIGSLLEIPCVVDYHAIANTPITYIEIQNRLSLQTSTRKTGYKTLVSAFLPYAAQRHNQEEYPQLKTIGEYNRDDSEIRKRSQFDSKAISFREEPSMRTMEEGASFVEVAQGRIQSRLQNQMEKANILETNAEKTSQQIIDTVDTIKKQVDKTRQQTLFNAEGNANRIGTATLDARLDDMKNRMIYAGAQEIPVDPGNIKATSLVEQKSEDKNDTIMSTPLTKVTATPESIEIENRKIEEEKKKAEQTKQTALKNLEINKADDFPNNQNNQDIQKSQSGDKSGNSEFKPRGLDSSEKATADIIKHDSKIHKNAMDAEKTADDVTKKVKSRREILAERHRKAMADQQKMIAAGEKEANKGMTTREEDIEILDAKSVTKAKSSTITASDMMAKTKQRGSSEDDIFSSNIDIDDIVRTLGS